MSDWDDIPTITEDDFVYDDVDDTGGAADLTETVIGPALLNQLAADAFRNQHPFALRQGAPAQFAAERLEAATKLLAAVEQVVRYRVAEVRAVPAAKDQGGPARRVRRGEDPERAPRLSKRWDEDDRPEQVGWRTVAEHWWVISSSGQGFVRGVEEHGPRFFDRLWRRFKNDPVVHQVQHNALVRVRRRFAEADQDNRNYPSWLEPGFPYWSDEEVHGAIPKPHPVDEPVPRVEQPLLWDMHDV